MKLYMTEMSGNSFKIRVLAAMLDVAYENVRVDWEHGEHKSPAFLELNPRGQVPVMEIEDKVLWDSTAHLVYIARRFGGEAWLPTDPLAMAEVMQWMAFAQNEVLFGLQWARGVTVYGRRPESFEGLPAGRQTRARHPRGATGEDPRLAGARPADACRHRLLPLRQARARGRPAARRLSAGARLAGALRGPAWLDRARPVAALAARHRLRQLRHS
jgi:glutathione S-transferase